MGDVPRNHESTNLSLPTLSMRIDGGAREAHAAYSGDGASVDGVIESAHQPSY